MGYSGRTCLSVISQWKFSNDRTEILFNNENVVCFRHSEISSYIDALSRKWPQPVVLRKIEDGHLNMRVWNPKVKLISLTGSIN